MLLRSQHSVIYNNYDRLSRKKEKRNKESLIYIPIFLRSASRYDTTTYTLSILSSFHSQNCTMNQLLKTFTRCLLHNNHRQCISVLKVKYHIQLSVFQHSKVRVVFFTIWTQCHSRNNVLYPTSQRSWNSYTIETQHQIMQSSVQSSTLSQFFFTLWLLSSLNKENLKMISTISL